MKDGMKYNPQLLRYSYSIVAKSERTDIHIG